MDDPIAAQKAPFNIGIKSWFPYSQPDGNHFGYGISQVYWIGVQVTGKEWWMLKLGCYNLTNYVRFNTPAYAAGLHFWRGPQNIESQVPITVRKDYEPRNPEARNRQNATADSGK